MERIEYLINKLKEQAAAQVPADQMLVTVQLLNAELQLKQTGTAQILGTAKVAVMMPRSIAVQLPAEHEKFIPKQDIKPHYEKPVAEEKLPIHEEMEKLLVDNGSVSRLQKNGQLDMVFDPMIEIPTLSHQSPGKEINDAGAAQPESINDKLRQGKTELVEVLKESSPVRDLRKAVGINDRFLFINDLFRGDENMYERCIKTINNFNIYPEAEYWITRELKVKLGWKDDSESAAHFYNLVKRRFS
jgi:hypothetical protein